MLYLSSRGRRGVSGIVTWQSLSGYLSWRLSPSPGVSDGGKGGGGDDGASGSLSVRQRKRQRQKERVEAKKALLKVSALCFFRQVRLIREQFSGMKMFFDAR